MTPTVLVVEDERIIADDICQSLEQMGYIVPRPVSTGKQAIDTAAELRPELVLMDIKLKGDMDGVTAAIEIRARLSIPVVYLSSHSDEATLTRAARSQPDGYLVKPFNDRDLGVAVAVAIEKHAQRRQEARAETTRLVHDINNGLSILMASVDFGVEEATRIGAHLDKLDIQPRDRAAFDTAVRGVGSLADAMRDAHVGATRIQSIVSALQGQGRAGERESGEFDVPPLADGPAAAQPSNGRDA